MGNAQGISQNANKQNTNRGLTSRGRVDKPSQLKTTHSISLDERSGFFLHLPLHERRVKRVSCLLIGTTAISPGSHKVQPSTVLSSVNEVFNSLNEHFDGQLTTCPSRVQRIHQQLDKSSFTEYLDNLFKQKTSEIVSEAFIVYYCGQLTPSLQFIFQSINSNELIYFSVIDLLSWWEKFPKNKHQHLLLIVDSQITNSEFLEELSSQQALHQPYLSLQNSLRLNMSMILPCSLLGSSISLKEQHPKLSTIISCVLRSRSIPLQTLSSSSKILSFTGFPVKFYFDFGFFPWETLSDIREQFCFNSLFKTETPATLNLNMRETFPSGDCYFGLFTPSSSESPIIRNNRGCQLYSQQSTFHEIYAGLWEDNYFNKFGIYRYSNGDRYEGEFSQGKKQGKGVYFFYDGNVYFGDFLDDLIQGQGQLYYSDGTAFIGGFKNSLRSGFGVLSSKILTIVGEFEDDETTGQASLKFSQFPHISMKINLQSEQKQIVVYEVIINNSQTKTLFEATWFNNRRVSDVIQKHYLADIKRIEELYEKMTYRVTSLGLNLN